MATSGSSATEPPFDYHARDNHALRNLRRSRELRQELDDAESAEDAALRQRILAASTTASRLRRAAEDPERAERLGFLAPRQAAGGLGATLPNSQAFSLVCEVERRLREGEIVETTSERQALEIAMSLTGCGRPIVEMARFVSKELSGFYVPSAALQLPRGPEPRLDSTETLSFEHLIVLVIMVNCNQRHG
jgi:hypothetical protein